MAQILLALALTSSAASACSLTTFLSDPSDKTCLEKLWMAHKLNFALKIDPDEDEARMGFFAQNMRRAAKLDADDPTGNYGATKFSHLSRHEFLRMYSRPIDYSLSEGSNKFACPADMCAASTRFPEFCNNTKSNTAEFNWNDYGAVTSIKSQGNCGDCFAFGGVGDLEGTHFLAGNDLISLSAQQITSCDRHCTAGGERLGCDGGCALGGARELVTFDYVVENGGIASEADYPFTNGGSYVKSDACLEDKEKNVSAVISSYCQISYKGTGYSVDEDAMIDVLLKNGPITIALDSSWMDSYTSGIGNPAKCSKSNLDHQVLIVGFGSEDGTDYWTIKNSWGEDWGEEGFCRVLRGENKCGVASDATHSIV